MSFRGFLLATVAVFALLPIAVLGDGALTPKPGRIFQHALGFQFWYPADWKVDPLEDNMARLAPPDAALPANAPGEYYLALGDASPDTGLTGLDDPRLLSILDFVVPGMAQIAPNMPAQLQRVGKPADLPMARGLGLVADWEGQAADDTVVRIRAFACVTDGDAVGLLAMGPRDRVAARDEILRSIFGSFGFRDGLKDPALVGLWSHEQDTYTLAADGGFEMQGGDRGRWAAGNGRLYLFFDDGSEADCGYTVEGEGDARALILHLADDKTQKWTYKGHP